VVGLVEAGLAAEGIDAGRDGVGELPADGGFGGEDVVRNLDERILRGGRNIARHDLVGLSVAGGRRAGAGRGLVPAQFIETGVERGRHHLEGALALDGNAGGIDAALDIGRGAERIGGNRVVKRERDVAQSRA